MRASLLCDVYRRLSPDLWDVKRTAARAKLGKDIALFGGGELFRSLLMAGLVDRVEVSLIPSSLEAASGAPGPSTFAQGLVMMVAERAFAGTGKEAEAYAAQAVRKTKGRILDWTGSGDPIPR
jgi:dihydrofolate reductase